MEKFLIVGLGNPGPQYELTRHNIGFLVLDFFVDALSLNDWKRKFKGIYLTANIFDKFLFFLKPHTFMNKSGESVKEVIRKESIVISSTLVVYDDVDMEFGKVKFKFGGGDGGHKGVRSIINEIGDRDFWRLKMGIGRGGDTVDYVLSRFDEEQFSLLDDFLKLASDAITCFLKEGPSKAMNEYNGRSVIAND